MIKYGFIITLITALPLYGMDSNAGNFYATAKAKWDAVLERQIEIERIKGWGKDPVLSAEWDYLQVESRKCMNIMTAGVISRELIKSHDVRDSKPIINIESNKDLAQLPYQELKIKFDQAMALRDALDKKYSKSKDDEEKEVLNTQLNTLSDHITKLNNIMMNNYSGSFKPHGGRGSKPVINLESDDEDEKSSRKVKFEAAQEQREFDKLFEKCLKNDSDEGKPSLKRVGAVIEEEPKKIKLIDQDKKRIKKEKELLNNLGKLNREWAILYAKVQAEKSGDIYSECVNEMRNIEDQHEALMREYNEICRHEIETAAELLLNLKSKR